MRPLVRPRSSTRPRHTVKPRPTSAAGTGPGLRHSADPSRRDRRDLLPAPALTVRGPAPSAGAGPSHGAEQLGDFGGPPVEVGRRTLQGDQVDTARSADLEDPELLGPHSLHGETGQAGRPPTGSRATDWAGSSALGRHDQDGDVLGVRDEGRSRAAGPPPPGARRPTATPGSQARRPLSARTRATSPTADAPHRATATTTRMDVHRGPQRPAQQRCRDVDAPTTGEGDRTNRAHEGREQERRDGGRSPGRATRSAGVQSSARNSCGAPTASS